MLSKRISRALGEALSPSSEETPTTYFEKLIKLSQFEFDSDSENNAGPGTEFVYQPLDRSRRTIRVIRLLNHNPGQRIQLELKHIDLTESGHICLSYCWGHALNTHSINIKSSDGEGHLMIRRNLWDFLQLANLLEINDWLWIDAVCINQSDIDERGQQVDMMADIYRQARCVFVYPGELSKPLKHFQLTYCDHKHAPAHLGQVSSEEDPLAYSDYSKEFLCCRHQRRSHSKEQRDVWPRPKHYPAGRLWTRDGLNPDRLYEFDYWTRMWIIQEIALAREAYLVQPNGLLCFSCIRAAQQNNDLLAQRNWKDFMKPASETRARSFDPFDPHNFGTVRGPVTNDTKKFMAHIAGTQHDLPPSSLFMYLEMFSGYKCQENNDRVFALLSLINRPPAFPVTYTRTGATFVLDVLEHFSVRSGRPSEHTQQYWLWSEAVALGRILQSRIVSICYSCLCQFVAPPPNMGWPALQPRENFVAFVPAMLVDAHKREDSDYPVHKCYVCQNLSSTYMIPQVRSCTRVDDSILLIDLEPDPAGVWYHVESPRWQRSDSGGLP